ncbi:ParB/RepB/Spo0J family partition protein, partial [Candidatus Saccharibacteria bacterium]|nr:ParB/RepB/Spo0J family partition protein [Candidatus Saccharibacteria bacterium]
MLIPTDFDTSLLVDEKDRVQKLALTDIHPNRSQPRKHFEEQALQELAQSIKQYGILQPIIVSPEDDNNSYKIVAGERRWRAAAKAGLDK